MSVSGWNPQIQTYDASLEAALIVSTQNQNVRSLFMGEPGAGKSVMALLYAYNIACILSMLYYHDMSRWEEFFNLDENVAIADRDKLLELIRKDFIPGSIILGDEMQMMVNSRDFKDPANRVINMFFQLMRPNRNVIIGTIQEQFVQDKQSRRLYTHFFDMGKLHAYDIGINFGKCKYAQMDPTNPSKTYYPFPREHDKTINILTGLLPPKKLLDKYDRLRDAAMRKVRDEKLDELKRLADIKKIKEDKQLNGSENTFTKLQSLYIDHPDMSGAQAARTIGCSEGYARTVKTKLGF